jgi:mutator protein MutT
MAHLIAPSVNVFIINGSKVLLGRRANTGWMDGHLCPPGGHVENGETPSVAMVREIQEELGQSIDPTDLEFLCVAARNNSPIEYVAYEFIIRDKNYHFTNAEPEKCSELVWVEIDDLPNDVIDHFRQIITLSVIGDRPYLELGY